MAGAHAGAAGFDCADDLATLSRLDNQILVDQLKSRYDDDKIYTYIGDILVAVNPFRPLEMYSRDYQRLYCGKQRSEESPHIFAVADAAYHQMLDKSRNQCVVISGESGAGKTESAKYVIRHITHLCRGSGTAAGDSLEHKIIQVNPLLEAFGNAQTNLNDNSSRFGKYTELIFAESGAVVGAKISEYLLEKSRVVDQASGEQNFHIFYYVFSDPQKSSVGLESPERYPYFSNPARSASMADRFEMFAEVQTALDDIGFTSDERKTVLVTIAAILHMSRIEFIPTADDDPLSQARFSEDAEIEIKRVCDLLKINQAALCSSLLETVNVTRGERVVRYRNKQEALDTCDALAKALYSRLFSWLVASVNLLLAVEPRLTKMMTLEIGILDIYGFECFETNSFEQLCINLANEYLQHFFNRHVFELELAEYAKEGVDGSVTVTYEDNKPLLDLFLTQPIGLLALLDEECTFPKATGQSLVEKYKTYFADTKNFVPIKRDATMFQIKHYAGLVEYDAECFLDKNRDLLAPAVVAVLQNSQTEIVAELFTIARTDTGRLNRLDHQRGSAQTRSQKLADTKSAVSVASGNTANKKAASLGHQYKTSLQILIDNMTQCAPHFVRCLKPNHELRPRDFQDDLILTQLKYTGMLETTRIRRDGYAVRPTFREFVERFRALAFESRQVVEPTLSNCLKILTVVGVEGAIGGRTKIFMRYTQLDVLESEIQKRNRAACEIQRHVRGMQARERVRPWLETARRQKKTMIKTFADLRSKSTAFAAVLTQMAQEDTERFSERREKMLMESRESTNRRRTDRIKQAEAEETKFSEERDRLFGTASTEYTEQLENLKTELIKIQERGAGGCEPIFAQLIKHISTRLHILRKKASTLKGELKSRRADLEKSLSRLKEVAAEREVMLPKILSGMLSEGSPELEALRIQAIAMHDKESHLTVDIERIQHTEKLASALLAEIHVAVSECEAHFAAAYGDRVKFLDATVETRSTFVETLNNELSTAKKQVAAESAEHELALTSLKTEHELVLESLKSIVQETKNENARLTCVVDDQAAAAETAKKELRDRARLANEKLSTTLADHAAELEKVKQEAMDWQSKARQQELVAAHAAEDHTVEVSKLRAELRTKEAALHGAESERDNAVNELASKVDAGQAAETSQLRVTLKAEQGKVSDLEFRLEQSAKELESQQNLLVLAKAEFAAMVNDFEKTLTEQSEVHRVALDNRVAEVESATAALQDARESTEKLLDTKEAHIGQLEAAAAQAKIVHLQEIEVKEEAVAKLHIELEEMRANNRAQVESLEKVKLQCVELESQAASAAAKLENSRNKFELQSSENLRTVVALRQTIDEHEASRENLVNSHQHSILELQEQINLLESEHTSKTSKLEARLSSANEQVDERVTALKDQISEYVDQIALADARKAELETQVALLTEANETHVTSETQLNFRVDELEAEVARLVAAAEQQLETVKEEPVVREVNEQDTAVDHVHSYAEAIRSMGRQNPGVVVPGDSEGVDLVGYVGMCRKGLAMPKCITIGRFTCKSYMTKAAGKNWHKRWTVLDLRSKYLSWYVDDREMHIGQKGSTEILDIVSVMKASKNEVVIQTKRKTLAMRSDSPELVDIWTHILGAVARTRPQHGAAN